ncbi:MAG: MFS transporter [Dehalococcoidia bacterium]
MFIYSIGFFAMFLAGVLFLTTVWNYSVLQAGLAITPGPAMVAVVAGPAGRLADRYGHRSVVLPALLIFAAGMAWWLAMLDRSPDLVGAWLPGMLLLGIGVGGTFPILSAAAMAAIPPSAFAVAGAVNQTARQLGGALGIALLIAVLGEPSADNGAAAFDWVWTFILITTIGAALASLALPPPAPRSDRRGSQQRGDATSIARAAGK